MSVLWGVPDKTAYYYTGGSAGTATPLVLPGGTYNNAGGALSIDANSDVVGYATPASSTGQVAALYYSNSWLTSYQLALPTGQGYTGQNADCIADAISPNGTYVVGSITYTDTIGTPPALPKRVAAYWTYNIDGGGNMTSTAYDLGTPLALVGASETLAVNNSGYTVGLMNGSATSDMGASSGYSNANHVWFYHLGDGSYTDLTALNGGNGLAELKTGGKTMDTGANLINSSGQVVGEMGVSGAAHAAVWSASAGLQDLNTLYSADLAAWSAAHGNQTIVLNDAEAINDSGWISGIATINGTGNQVFLLALPVPEPSTLLLAAMGLAGLLAFAWKRRRS